MSLENEVEKRANTQCELCTSTKNLTTYLVPPIASASIDNTILVCDVCLQQINKSVEMDANHWRCLNDSMWSPVIPVQVMAWRLLHRIKGEGWPQDLLDMMYLEDETLRWAKESGDDLSDDEKVIHKDSNGVILQQGDSVFLTKDLNVKGTSFVAKRGAVVRNISLVHDNAEQIEGKVNGQHIVILTQYVKKN